MADNVEVFAPSEAETKILRDSGSFDKNVSIAAARQLAKALELPLRQGVLNGDILSGIFEPIKLDRNATPEFPLDFLAPGTEKNFVAYTMPNAGYIPQRHIEGDYVMVPVYDIAAGIDWNLKYARDARWDVVGRAMEVMRAQFVKKLNDDGWQTLITAGFDRNIVVLDSDASTGQFTKRLVSLMKTVMRRNGGGNSTSINRGRGINGYQSYSPNDVTLTPIDDIDTLFEERFDDMRYYIGDNDG